jgi:hypothetical protein
MADAGGEQPGGPHRGSDFQNLHRTKRAMTLNLRDSKGRDVFRRLAVPPKFKKASSRSARRVGIAIKRTSSSLHHNRVLFVGEAPLTPTI